MRALICGERVGERKAVLTKYALICHTIVNIAYLIVCTLTKTVVPESFIMWVTIGYGGISGGSFWANAEEHKSKLKEKNNDIVGGNP